ncbi:transmembrane protein, putative [Medicago truncatula]|uniref:Transmembrane protein, putative n=1 Tax=Medicago truncatula TaxID=3880 RepID=G7JG01_MEDTR|nr:transmembrane protein, putative [Medicago truncatula]
MVRCLVDMPLVGLFRDHLGTFCGAFCCNIGIQTVFYAEVLGFIIAIEFAAHGIMLAGWVFRLSLLTFFREGNCCADKLASLGHYRVGEVWMDNVPTDLSLDFFRDRCGLPNYRLP